MSGHTTSCCLPSYEMHKYHFAFANTSLNVADNRKVRLHNIHQNIQRLLITKTKYPCTCICGSIFPASTCEACVGTGSSGTPEGAAGGVAGAPGGISAEAVGGAEVAATATVFEEPADAGVGGGGTAGACNVCDVSIEAAAAVGSYAAATEGS